MVVARGVYRLPIAAVLRANTRLPDTLLHDVRVEGVRTLSSILAFASERLRDSLDLRARDDLHRRP